MESIVVTNFQVNAESFTLPHQENPNHAGKFYLAKYQLRDQIPSKEEVNKMPLKVEHFDRPKQQQIINEIVDEVANNPIKKDVLVYIHGYVPFQTGHNLYSLYEIREKYFGNNSSLTKIIYISWPGFGWIFFREAQEAYNIGNNLCNQLYRFFYDLSNSLKAEGGKLHLIVHSWGNRLLGGFCSRLGSHMNGSQSKMFNCIFLVAADIPSRSLNISGVLVDGRTYKLRVVKNLGDQIYIFYDEQDAILALSKKYVETPYERVGIIGYTSLRRIDNISFIDATNIDGIPSNLPPAVKGNIILNEDRREMADTRHRYFVSSYDVAQKILSLMKNHPA